MRTRLLMVGTLLVLLAGCAGPATSGAEALAGHSTGPESSQAVAPHRQLACRGDQFAGGILDYFTRTGGETSPEQAVDGMVRPGEEVVVAPQSKGATAYLLRPDGTTYAILGIARLVDDTWRVEQIDSCAGEFPLGR